MNIVCIGAHPDDGEYFAGGTCVKWARKGHRVLLLSLTNGDIGHFGMSGDELARRRAEEARLSAERGGCEHLVLDNHDGELMPTLELRKDIVRILREYRADVVLTHRPNDYHPDHRYTSLSVQDAAFMVTVPKYCPEVPRLEKNPVFFYLMDPFTKPNPFSVDVAVDVDDAMSVKWDMLDAMESQFYEWLPWLWEFPDEVPSGTAERRAWLEQAYAEPFRRMTERTREGLARFYGAEHAGRVAWAEGFEFCEYGSRPGEEELRTLFPFFPEKG
jgi:LmbE family N-acetylglucosaminyl deacetylase